MTFSLKFSFVPRDYSQGHGNQIPLNSPEMMKIFGLVNQAGNIADGLEIDSIETTSGQQPQNEITQLFTNPFKTTQQNREVAADTNFRKLVRGAYTLSLQTLHPNDRRFIFEQLAKAAGTEQNADGSLTLKVFDSQNNFEEIEDTIEIVKDLREQGYKIDVEIAVTHSNQKDADGNAIYSSQYYKDKFSSAAEIAKRFNNEIEGTVRTISLKNMVGDIDYDNAKEMVNLFADIKQEQGLSDDVMFALHSHNTGVAVEANAGFIAAARERDIGVIVDVMGKSEQGFAGILDVAKESGIEVPQEQREIFEKIGEITDELHKKYVAARPPQGLLSGEDLRRHGIPGGGWAAMLNHDIKAIDLPARLKKYFEENPDKKSEYFDLNDPLKSTAQYFAIRMDEVGRDFGYPLPVTPGFKFKCELAKISILNEIAGKDRDSYEGKYSDFEDPETGQVLGKFGAGIADFFRGDNMPYKLSEEALDFVSSIVEKEAEQGNYKLPEGASAQGRRLYRLSDAAIERRQDFADELSAQIESGKLDLKGHGFDQAVACALIIGSNAKAASLFNNISASNRPGGDVQASKDEWVPSEKDLERVNNGEASAMVDVSAAEEIQPDEAAAAAARIPLGRSISSV